MRIDRLDLQNVRVIESFTATFSPGFNVIIGENGSGKSTILAILGRILSLWTPKSRRVVQAADQRERLENIEENVVRTPCGDIQIGVMGIGSDGLPFATYSGLRADERSNERAIDDRRNRYLRLAERDISQPLPLVALFLPWREPPRSRKPRVDPSGPRRRLEGYEDALDLHVDFSGFASWFKTFEMQHIVDGLRVPALEAARQAVIGCIPGCTGFAWIPKLDEIVVTVHGVSHPIWRLSDGFRAMLALVGELAWRAVILNPGMGGEVAQKVDGVVLIDELDLHLHPRWQRRVVEDLRRAFPRVQFIATTHSPFIVQSMRKEEVINLDHHAAMEFWREGIEDIAAEAMGVEDTETVPRSRLYRELEAVAEEYYQLLDHRPEAVEEIAARRARLDVLEEHFTDSPVLAAFLRSQRLAREGGA